VSDFDRFNGFGQQLDTAEAVAAGPMIQAIKRTVAKEATGGLDAAASDDNGFSIWGRGFAASPRLSLANTRAAQYTLLRSRSCLNQVIHLTTHSLARCFLEVDANYKQYRTAARLRDAAAERLELQRDSYDEGRITVDRYLDAISRYAMAVAVEHQYLTTYNISLAAQSQAKGTLLSDRNIVVAEGPRPAKTWRAAHVKIDDQAMKTSLEATKTNQAGGTAADAKPGIWTFSIRIGALPIEIKGTYSPSSQTKSTQTAD
jgi:hypothetical protein